MPESLDGIALDHRLLEEVPVVVLKMMVYPKVLAQSRASQ